MRAAEIRPGMCIRWASHNADVIEIRATEESKHVELTVQLVEGRERDAWGGIRLAIFAADEPVTVVAGAN